MSRTLIILLLLCNLAGCRDETGQISLPTLELNWHSDSADARQTTWNTMVGRWYGDRMDEDGERIQWITQRHADGTYQVDFRSTTARGRIENSTDLGQWGMAGPIYFGFFRGWLEGDVFTPSDPRQADNYDAYNVISLTDDLMIYDSLTTGTRYEARRVPEGFHIPDAASETRL
ncbi:hypothetical protein [Halopseudomonas sabulinigri]|uniref:Lipoprotein n=1 Tax=Halopseudomonas sabulinigri TaxID=472181 RepID=A0ABP9ZL95_9GAMM